MRSPFRRLLAIFVTGALTALPLAATLLILVWAAQLAAQYLGPYSTIGWTLRSIGLSVSGSEVFAYAVGVLIVLIAIFVLGLIVQSRLSRFLTGLTDGLVRRIPVVRSVYDTVSKLVGMFAQREDGQTRSMRPVWLHFGGEGSTAVLGLLSTPEAIRIGDIDYFAVLIPTSPVPVGGGLVYVPTAWVKPADVGVEGLTSIYVSMGITSAQHLSPRVPPTADHAAGSPDSREAGAEQAKAKAEAPAGAQARALAEMQAKAQVQPEAEAETASPMATPNPKSTASATAQRPG